MRRPARTILAIVLSISVLARHRGVRGDGLAAARRPSLLGRRRHPSPAGIATTTPPIRACGTPHVQGDGPDGTVSIDVCDDPPPIPPEPHVVVPTPGMVDVHPIPFDQVRVGSDRRTVQIDFVAGIEPCSVLDHVDVRYGANSVTITLSEGSDPAAGQIACIMIAEFKRVIVHLDQPLGDRTIVDGAKTGIREG